MFRSTAFSALAFCLFTAMPVALPGAQPVLPPPIPPNRSVALHYSGTVTEVAKSSITIQWTLSPEVLPKTFLLSEDLMTGKVPMRPRPDPKPNVRPYSVMPIYMYRLSDVRVGDAVVIMYAHVGDVDICDHICIRKRPGGRMPPLAEEAEKLMNPEEVHKAHLARVRAKYPDKKFPPPRPSESFGTYIPYHEQMNAHWDLFDKGIPYPEKFGKKRRFPVAPMPREAEPKTAPAKP